MGKKTNYFRHSLDAHNDPKLIELMAKEGLRGIGAYFILLEIYGRALINDDEHKIEQKISLKQYANAIGSRSDHALNLIITQSQLGLIVLLRSTYDDHNIVLSVPNFMKYFGSYKKTEPVKIPNKRKEKQNKIKNNINSSNQFADSPQPENPEPPAQNKNLENQPTDAVKIIFDYLNLKLGAKFKATTDANKKLVRSRIAEGFTIDDFKKVIDSKCAEWVGTEFQKYIRPQTIFGPKFESYLNQPQVKSFEQFLQENALPEAE